MLISTSHLFIILSPTKVASTSVGAALSNFCDIRIGSPRFGKHHFLKVALERYRWIFDEIPIHEFTIILLFREPFSRLASLYNSHLDPAFDECAQSTKNLTVDQFLTDWVPSNLWMSCPQFLHGCTADQGFKIDFIVRQSSLVDDLCASMAEVGIDLDKSWITNLNRSNASLSESKIKLISKSEIAEIYAFDSLLYERYAGRMLCEKDKSFINDQLTRRYMTFDPDELESYFKRYFESSQASS